jgi:hypothetical protein
MPLFKLIPANDFIWNQADFTQFLVDNQGSAIELSTNSEGVCLRSAGVYELLEKFRYTDVNIFTSNLLEAHDTFQIHHTDRGYRPWRFFKVNHANYEHVHHWNLKKVFGCFYNRPLWHRIGLAATLQHDHHHCSMINIRPSCQDPDQRDLFEIHQLFKYHPESFIKFSKVCDSWPLKLEDLDGYTVGNTTTGHTDQVADFYVNFLIDIVAETWTQGNSFFPTEKTIRPMLLKKPFVVFGPKNYLEYLRQMGFKTFGDFWSEEYDGYDNRDRYTKILELIDQLAKKSTSELEKMYWDMQYTLDHNYDLLLNQTYKKKISHVE